MRKRLKKWEKEKGITLIALVITIIVLLILAAVSIATLTGENGILTQATKAGEDTKNATEKEQIELACVAVMGENRGEITKEQLETELKKYDNGITVTEDGENFKVTYPNENVYTVKKDGTIEKATNNSGSTATAEEVNALIGQTVTSYTESSEKVNAWRVFYASDTEMFLISSNTISSSEAFGGSSGIPLKAKSDTDYTGAENVFETTYGATYNGMWKKICDEKNKYDANERSKATAYLCDQTNWTEYVGANAPDGTYAVGGPTKELLVRSWVASGQTTGEKEANLKEILDDTEVSDAGYTYNKPTHLYDDDPILTTILPKTEGGTDGLYNNGSPYLLASPSSFSTDGVCSVSSSGYVNGSDYRITGNGARPLVSIPMSKVQIENGIVTIGSN